MSDILLTVCIPSITTRISKGFQPLLDKLNNQVGDNKQVEIISIMDNKRMSVGRKRQALFQMARGKYVCQVDDDDDVEPDFISTVLNAITETSEDPPEVITYDQHCDMDGQIMFVECDINSTAVSEPRFNVLKNRIIIKRYPWHWCCWRNDIAKRGNFYDCNGIEDGLFPRQMKNIVTKQYNIPKVLLRYIFRSSGTASPYYAMDPNNPPKICSLKVTE